MVGGATVAVVAIAVLAMAGGTASKPGAGNGEETVTSGTCSVTFKTAKNKREEVDRFLASLPHEFCQDAPWPLYFMADDELVAIFISLKPGGSEKAKGFLVMTATQMANDFQRRACWLIRGPDDDLGNVVDRVCVLPSTVAATADGGSDRAPACGDDLDSNLSKAGEKATQALVLLKEAGRVDNPKTKATRLEAASSSLDAVANLISWASPPSRQMRLAAGRLQSVAAAVRSGGSPGDLQDVVNRIRAATIDLKNSEVVRRCNGNR